MVVEVLYMDQGVVKLVEEGLSLMSFRRLYMHDKNAGKPLFKRYITYIWYMYSKSSAYATFSEMERISMIEEKIIDGSVKSWDKLLQDKLFSDCVTEYVAHTKTREERQYERLMDDIDKAISNLELVPLTKEVKMFIDAEDEETGQKIKKQALVEVDNMDEKIKANTNIKNMYALADYYKDKIKSQTGPLKKKYLRIFDKKENG